MRSDWNDEAAQSDEWEQWLIEHAPIMLLFARNQSRCEADAQDLVQEAIVESWQRLSRHGPPPLPVVYATIRRRAVDLGRRQDRRATREAAAHLDDPVFWFDSSAEERERNQILQDAMSRISMIYREVVLLKTWGDLTFAEIAQALEIPANTAASRYRYGLLELRRLLGNDVLIEMMRR